MRSRRKKNSNNNFSSIQFRLDDEPRAVGWTRFASSCGGSQMADSTSRHVKCRIKDGEYFSTPINLVWSEPMRIAMGVGSWALAGIRCRRPKMALRGNISNYTMLHVTANVRKYLDSSATNPDHDGCIGIHLDEISTSNSIRSSPHLLCNWKSKFFILLMWLDNLISGFLQSSFLNG